MSNIKYKAFIKIVELGSFSAAARALNYSQPGIHHMITSLEKEYGVQLLTKFNDKVVPTSYGESIIDYCYQIVNNDERIKETLSSLTNHTSTTIRLGAFNSTLVDLIPKIINHFSKAYSDTKIHIKELDYKESIEALQHHSVDFCFMNDNCPKGFHFIPLYKDPTVIVMPKDHPLTSYDKIPISALENCNMLMYNAGNNDVLQTILQKKDINFNSQYYVDRDTSLYSMAQNSNSIIAMSKMHVYHLPEHLTYRLFDVDLYRNIGIVIDAKKLTDISVNEFIRCAKEVISLHEKKYGVRKSFIS